MARARFRCYAELNDFLEPAQRQREVELNYEAPAPVRHLMETLGIPHTEVELILVNGRSVGLDQRVGDGDRVSLYPVFEALDVSEHLRIRPQPLRQSRFLLDAHLGKLARYLRLLGFDALFQNDWGDATLARISTVERRILLTRDRALLMRSEITHGCYIRPTDPRRQLTYLVGRLDLYEQIRPFTRCTLCNALLETVAKAQIADRLPARVRANFDSFWQCRGCGQLYWQGSHYDRLRALIEKLLGQHQEH
jgi:uncharacterized protein with PIN domain